MSNRARLLLTVIVFALATPAAQASAPSTAFDGHYVGVSAHIGKSTGHGRQCPRMHTPDALTITNGVVQSGARDKWSGTLGPQGDIVLRNKLSMRIKCPDRPARRDQRAVSGFRLLCRLRVT
jgi:hypothetical protein